MYKRQPHGVASDSEKQTRSSLPYPPFTIERRRVNRGGDGEPAKLGCWIVNGAPDGPRQQTESRAAAAAALRALLAKSPTVAIAAEAMARAGVPVDCRTAVEPGDGDGGSVLLSASSVDGTCVLAVGLVFEPPGAFSKTKKTTDDEKNDDEKNARVKALVLKAEDARLMADMPLMKRHYAELFALNNELIAEYNKRANNHEALLAALKDVNQIIQKASNLRAGAAKSRVVAEARAAIKTNAIDSLYQIVCEGRSKVSLAQ